MTTSKDGRGLISVIHRLLITQAEATGHTLVVAAAPAFYPVNSELQQTSLVTSPTTQAASHQLVQLTLFLEVTLLQEEVTLFNNSSTSMDKGLCRKQILILQGKRLILFWIVQLNPTTEIPLL